MRLSQYIDQLSKVIAYKGDLECVNWIENEDLDSSTEGWHEQAKLKDIEDGIKNKIETSCTYITTKGKKEYCSMNDKGYIDCQKEEVFVIGHKVAENE